MVLDPLGRLDLGDGRRYVPEQLAQKFPSTLKPFAAVSKQYPGFPTIFRLPLRQAGSAFGKKWGVHDVKGLLDRFLKDQAAELLLFAKSVGQVTFAVRAENGTAQPLQELSRKLAAPPADGPSPRKSARRTKHASPAASLAPPKKQDSFMLQLPNTIEEVLKLQTAPRDGLEQVTITSRVGGRAPDEAQWLIAHALAVDADGVRLIRNALLNSTPTALLPHGAVALRLNAPSSYVGNVAAYMPVGMAWGAPMVLHGCFALHHVDMIP